MTTQRVRGLPGLRSQRLKRGLTQEHLGALVGMSRHTIMFHEQGKVDPMPGTTRKLAEVLNVHIEDLLGEDMDGNYYTLAGKPKLHRIKNRYVQPAHITFITYGNTYNDRQPFVEINFVSEDGIRFIRDEEVDEAMRAMGYPPIED